AGHQLGEPKPVRPGDLQTPLHGDVPHRHVVQERVELRLEGVVADREVHVVVDGVAERAVALLGLVVRGPAVARAPLYEAHVELGHRLPSFVRAGVVEPDESSNPPLGGRGVPLTKGQWSQRPVTCANRTAIDLKSAVQPSAVVSSYTGLPSISVMTTFASAISPEGAANRLRSTTARSASLPTSTEPVSASRWFTYALPIVNAATAVPRSIRSSGRKTSGVASP